MIMNRNIIDYTNASYNNTFDHTLIIRNNVVLSSTTFFPLEKQDTEILCNMSYFKVCMYQRFTTSLRAAFHLRVFHTHVYARKTLNRFKY